MIGRIKGQEVTAQVFIDGVQLGELGPFFDVDVELKHEVHEAEYLGELNRQFDSVFKGVRIEINAEVGDGWQAVLAHIAENGRVEYRRALAEHILEGGWVGQYLVHAGGMLPAVGSFPAREAAPFAYLAQVVRMVQVEGDPTKRVFQALSRASFDDGYDPDPEAQRRARHGALPRHEEPFPTPTVEELMGQLERSEHPWVAMDVGASGCVDTIIHLKRAASEAPAHGVAALLREQVLTPADARASLLSDGHLDGPTSGWEIVDVTNEVLAGVDHRRRVHPRGRWRRRKQVVRKLAADLGWPGCLAVASDDQIVAGVLAAGVRLRDWRRFEGGGRRHPKVRRAEAVLASRRLIAEDGVPF